MAQPVSSVHVDPPGARLLRRFFLSSAGTGVVFAALVGAPSASTLPTGADCGLSPEGEILAVSNNVYEADKGDASKPGDMKRFVARMKEMTPYAPDIVLVQEVRAAAVARIKNLLAENYTCKFSIAANAGETPWKWKIKYTRLLGRDTAVITNTDSMSTLRTGHITTGYKRSEASGPPIRPKKAAWAKLREKNQPDEAAKPLRVVAASVHFPRGSAFKNAATSERVKRRSAKKIADKVETILSDGSQTNNRIHIIAGDFNSHRYSEDPSNENPPYRLLTNPPYNYTDGIIEHATGGNPNPIDFVLSTGKSLQADYDKNNPHDEDSPDFYSNHDIRWSLIAPY